MGYGVFTLANNETDTETNRDTDIDKFTQNPMGICVISLSLCSMNTFTQSCTTHFLIRLWIGLSVEQCEHTTKCRCFPGYLKLIFRIQLEAIWTSHSKSRFVGLVFNWKQLEVFSFNEPNLPVVHQIRLVKFYAEILILLPMFSVVSSSFVWQPISI